MIINIQVTVHKLAYCYWLL